MTVLWMEMSGEWSWVPLKVEKRGSISEEWLYLLLLWPPYEQPHSLCRQTHHIGVLLSPQLLPQHCHCGYLEGGGSVIQSNDACIGGHTNSDPERLAGGRIINLGGGVNNSKSKASDVFSMARSTDWCPTYDHVSITNGLQLQGNRGK